MNNSSRSGMFAMIVSISLKVAGLATFFTVTDPARQTRGARSISSSCSAA
jgi:hypothetical protein